MTTKLQNYFSGSRKQLPNYDGRGACIHSVKHFTTWAQGIQAFPWLFPTPVKHVPPLLNTYTATCRLPQASGLSLCLQQMNIGGDWGSIGATVICLFVSNTIFTNFLAPQVPLKYLLYLLCVRLSKKSVNMRSYPGILP